MTTEHSPNNQLYSSQEAIAAGESAWDAVAKEYEARQTGQEAPVAPAEAKKSIAEMINYGVPKSVATPPEIIDPTIARLDQVRRDIKADLDWYQANVKFGVNEAEIDVRIGDVENYLNYGIMTDDVRAALEERRKQLLLFLADINAAKVWKP